MQLEELRKAYRLTWLEWARLTDALQQIVESGHPDRELLERLLLDVEYARAAHNEARDRLAHMLGHTPAPVTATEPGDGRVRNTANLLWEFAGRPEGTAESDWRRARAMVQTAGSGARES